MLIAIWRDIMAGKKKSKVFTPLTKRTWVNKFKSEFEGDTSILTGYMECIDRQNPVLEKMVKTAKKFEELKEQILNFTKDQGDLVKEMRNKWNSPQADKYGFPKADALSNLSRTYKASHFKK
ncbi:hypothetical protein A4D02_30815 [Niastella koreensis]|uniref:Uncharacterized protein n=2 Tax=Niastella koreensis TaxID=354356 RepID=G8T8Y8_NIAKG|nr:hypothetical protein [Niastella koreensis]AEW02345.1 hypothetical protein Niako_6120 [Niastella koreensis GR20-10]OQP46435.1 hypothetical protein A4D02_30815 [Niastella koreensis]